MSMAFATKLREAAKRETHKVKQKHEELKEKFVKAQEDNNQDKIDPKEVTLQSAQGRLHTALNPPGTCRNEFPNWQQNYRARRRRCSNCTARCSN